MLPSWSRLRVSRLLALLAGFGVVGVMVVLPGEGSSACSAAHPCQPDRLGAVSAGLLFATMITTYVHWRTAAWLATAAAATFMLSELLARSTPWWTPVLYLGYAALFRYLPGDATQPRESVIAATVPVVDHRRIPWPQQTPHPGRHRWTAAALLAVAAVACAVWGVADQARGEARQHSADVVTGVVVDHPDQVTVRLTLPGPRQVDVPVIDAGSYPTGDAFPVYLDGTGAVQPVSEPYDATSWLALAAILLGLATAVARHGAEHATALRQLLDGAQPVRAVRAIEGRLEVRLYHPAPAGADTPLATVPMRYADPPDGRAHWPRPATHWGWLTPQGHDDDHPSGAGWLPATDLPDGAGRPDDALTVADLLPPEPVPALLYGDPRSGGWCAVEVNGRIRLPRGPAHAEDDILTSRPHG